MAYIPFGKSNTAKQPSGYIPFGKEIKPFSLDLGLPEFDGMKTTTAMAVSPEFITPQKMVGEMGKEVGQSIMRNFASLIGSEALDPVVSPILKKVADIEKKSPTFKYFTEEMANRLYGDLALEEVTELVTGETRGEQIRPIGERVITLEGRLEKKKEEYKELLETPGLSVNEKIVLKSLSSLLENKAVAPLIIGAYTGIDTTFFGGGTKGVIQAFKTANKMDDAVKVLTKLRLSDDLIRFYAPEVVKVKSDKMAKALFESISNAQLTKRVAPKVAPKIAPEAQKAIPEAIPAEKGIIPQELQPLAQEARKYKSAEEFAESLMRPIDRPVGFKGELGIERLQDLFRRHFGLKPVTKITDTMVEAEKLKIYNEAKTGGFAWAQKPITSKPVQDKLKIEAAENLAARVSLTDEATMKSQLADFFTQAVKGVGEVPVKPPGVLPIKKPPVEELGVRIEERIRELVPKVKTIASGIRQGKIIARKDILKAGDELKATLKSLKVDPIDAKWFDDTFKNIKGVEDLANKIPSIIARAERLTNAREIRTLKTGIEIELKKAKPFIGEKKALESKIGPQAQNIMDFLRGRKDLNGKPIITEMKAGQGLHIKGNRAEAIAKIEDNINKYGTAVDGVTPEIPAEIARQNAMLDMVGIQRMSVAELRKTFTNIKSLRERGQLELLIKQANKSAKIELIQDAAKVEMRSPKIKPEVIGEAARELNPVAKVTDAIENVLLGIRNITEKATFGKEFRVAEWIGDTIRVARNNYNRIGTQWNNAKVRAFKDIFGEKKLGKIYQQMGKEQMVFKGKNALGNSVEMKLNQFEAAYWWGLSKDPTNIPLFMKNMDFTPEMFKVLDNFVDPRMKRYTEYLMDDWLKMIKGPVGERYKVKFGMEMPENPNYLPRMYGDKKFEEEITNLLIGDVFPWHPSTVPSGVKARIGSRAAFRRISIEQVMRKHSEQMNQFVHFDEAISDVRRVFTNSEVKNTILRSSGKDIYDTLIKKIDDIARGGMAAQLKIGAIDWFVGRFTQASLMFNWVPFLKQLTSYPAFTLGRGGLKYGELLSGSMVYARNPVEWTKRLAESDFIFGRLTKGFNRETALAFRQGDKGFTIKEVGMTLEDFLGKAAITPTRGGDMVPIMPGLTAKYIQTTKQLQRTTKLSAEAIHKKALAAAEELASRTQQSPWIEDLGRIQTANSVGKAISMYSTTPIQYLRESTGAIRMWNRGQIGTREMVRTIFTAWVVLPQLFQYVSNGFTWNNERQMRALLLGPVNYYPAAGNLMGTMYDAFTKGETWKSVASGISPLFSIPESMQQSLASLQKILFKDLTPEQQEKEWKRFAEKLYITIALTTGKLPSTAPRTIDGIMDLARGDTEDVRRIWFSEYALDSGEEELPPRTGGASMDRILKDLGLPPLESPTKMLPKLPALPGLPPL